MRTQTLALRDFRERVLLHVPKSEEFYFGKNTNLTLAFCQMNFFRKQKMSVGCHVRGLASYGTVRNGASLAHLDDGFVKTLALYSDESCSYLEDVLENVFDDTDRTTHLNINVAVEFEQ